MRFGRGQNQRIIASVRTGSKIEVPTTEPSAFLSTPKLSLRPFDRSSPPRPFELSNIPFHSLLRSCQYP
eukprot:636515-Prymnesium_polylepis.1